MCLVRINGSSGPGRQDMGVFGCGVRGFFGVFHLGWVQPPPPPGMRVGCEGLIRLPAELTSSLLPPPRGD